MDVVDVKGMKKNLEEKLLELFTEFELDTGVRLIEVEVESMEINSMTTSKRVIIKVKTKVEL